MLSGCAPLQGSDGNETAQFQEIATNATYGCRRPHGYGLYDAAAGKTFVCWNGGGMSVFGRAFDHAAGEWSPVKEIRHLEYFSRPDYHNYPNMAQAPDGRLMIAWADHGDSLFLARANQPHDLMGEWETREIAVGKNAYPMLISTEDAVYVFYSVNMDIRWPYRPFGYIKSVDHGATWSEHRPAFDSQKKDPGKYDEVYANNFEVEAATPEHPLRIQFAWTMHGGPTGHNRGSRNAYFAYFMPETETWMAADGTELGDLIDLDEMLAHCIVVESGPAPDDLLIRGLVSTHLDTGEPVVAYSRDRTVHWAVHRDGEWQHREIAPGFPTDLRRKEDGTLRMASHVDVTTSQLQVWELDEAAREWRLVLESEIPFGNGSDRAWQTAFIDQGRPEFEMLIQQKNREEDRSDYSGKWPVFAVDLSAAP
ncbi:MAG: BNR-4 repeat-containing protein [Verrucomicrobiota bacterium JB022]|nr:BNR-4 repeat-containing protein [Verrucomicrobiota bacterium JB022]